MVGPDGHPIVGLTAESKPSPADSVGVIRMKRRLIEGVVILAACA